MDASLARWTVVKRRQWPANVPSRSACTPRKPFSHLIRVWRYLQLITNICNSLRISANSNVFIVVTVHSKMHHHAECAEDRSDGCRDQVLGTHYLSSRPVNTACIHGWPIDALHTREHSPYTRAVYTSRVFDRHYARPRPQNGAFLWISPSK